LGLGPKGPAVIAVEDPPGFDVDVCGFDGPADLVDARVALVVAFRELSSDGFLGRGDRSGALVALIRDDLVDVDVPGDVVLVPGGLVVAAAGQGVGDPRHLAVGVGRDLVALAGGVVVGGVQLGVVTVGPAGGKSAVEYENQLLREVVEGWDVVSDSGLDRSFERGDGPR